MLPVPSIRRRDKNTNAPEETTPDEPRPTTAPEPAPAPAPFSRGDLDALAGALPEQMQAALYARNVNEVARLAGLHHALPFFYLDNLAGDIEASLTEWREKLDWARQVLAVAEQNAKTAQTQWFDLQERNAEEVRQAEREGRRPRLISEDARRGAQGNIDQAQAIVAKIQSLLAVLEEAQAQVKSDMARCMVVDTTLEATLRQDTMQQLRHQNLKWADLVVWAGRIPGTPAPPQV